jgi:hypothetical protein
MLIDSLACLPDSAVYLLQQCTTPLNLLDVRKRNLSLHCASGCLDGRDAGEFGNTKVVVIDVACCTLDEEFRWVETHSKSQRFKNPHQKQST